MTAEYIRTIESLASGFADRSVTLYFPDFETAPPQGSLNQVYGAPVGAEADSWPHYPGLPDLLRRSGDAGGDDGDLRMEHVFTVDLRGLEGIGAPAKAKALQLYISNAGYHEGWSPGTDHTQVVFLGEEDVARGAFVGELPARSRRHEPRRFSLVRVDVPVAVFGEPDKGTALAELRAAIWKAPARIGGEPMWLQGDPDEQEDDGFGDDGGYDEDGEGEDGGGDDGETEEAPPRRPLGIPAHGGFFLQFDESFADVNLGDSGVMYVFGGDAHFQCF